MRLFIHIPIALILVFFAAVALTVYLVTQTTFVHSGINLLLAQYIEAKYNVKVDFGEIGGSILRDLTVDNVRVDFEKAPDRYRLAKIKQVRAYYNINNLWYGLWRLDSLILDQPTVVLRSDTTGKLLVPSLGGGGSTEKKPSRDLAIDHFRLTQGRFQWFKSRSVIYIDSIDMRGSGGVTNGAWKVTLDTLNLSHPQKNFHITEARLKLALVHDTVSIDSFYLATDRSTLDGGGIYPLNDSLSYRINFTNSHLSLAELSAVAGTKLEGDFDFSLQAQGNWKAFGGNADLDGTLFGRQLGPLNTDYAFADGVLSFSNLVGEAFDGQIEGAIELNVVARPEVFSADLQVNGINLDKILPNTFHSRINGMLQINGSGLGSDNFNLDLDVDCDRGSFDFVNYDSLRGTISLNVADMYYHPGFALYYKHSAFTAEGVVSYNGDMQLNGDFTTNQLADFWGNLFIKKLSGGGHGTYVVSGANRDPDIRGVFQGDSCSFYGFATDSLTARFDIKSFLYGRQGSVSLKSFKSNVWNLPADSVHANIDIDSNLVGIDAAAVYHPRYLLKGKGTAIVHDSTASAKIDSLDFIFDSLIYTTTEPVPVEFLVDRIVVDRLNLKGKEGALHFTCEYGYDSTISLTASSDSFHFAPWLMDLGDDSLVTGVMNLRGGMKGKLGNPAIVIAGEISDLAYGRDSLGRLDIDLRYSDSQLTVNSLAWHFKGGGLTGSGNFPLIMNLDSGIVKVPSQPMQLTLNSSGQDLSLLASLNSNIESLLGEYQLQLEIYGTPQQPQSRGFFDLKNGTLKVYQMENPIENLKAEIKSQDKLITVDWVEGTARYKGHEGIVRADGNITIRSKDLLDYDLVMMGQDVPVKYDLGDIYGRCDFDLDVRGSLPPKITGKVTVKEAAYYDEFEAPEVSAAIRAADIESPWDYVINATMLPASVTFKNSDFNMVLDGDLTIIREGGHDNYLGTLNIVRGNSYLFDLNFLIEDGSQIIFDNIEQPNPALDIKVSTRVRNYAGDVSNTAYDKLNLVIGGTILQPSIKAAEGSPYSDKDIASVIIANKPATLIENDPLATSSFQRRLQIGAYGYLAARTSQALSRAFGVEVFEIAPTYTERNTLQGASVSLGLYTLPSIYTYVSSLSLDGRADYGVEHRFGKHVYMGANKDRENQWHLNLNLNWEFK